MYKMTQQHRQRIQASRLNLGIGKSEFKTCPRCKKSLPRKTHFGIRFNGFTDSYCKDCFNPSAVERQRKYLLTHPEVADKIKRTNRAVQMKRKYGISIDVYDTLFEKQKGVCAICHNPPKTKNLFVDHDHTTGKIRGLLCSPCNFALGAFRDQVGYLKRAIKYLTH